MPTPTFAWAIGWRSDASDPDRRVGRRLWSCGAGPLQPGMAGRSSTWRPALISVAASKPILQWRFVGIGAPRSRVTILRPTTWGCACETASARGGTSAPLGGGCRWRPRPVTPTRRGTWACCFMRAVAVRATTSGPYSGIGRRRGSVIRRRSTTWACVTSKALGSPCRNAGRNTGCRRLRWRATAKRRCRFGSLQRYVADGSAASSQTPFCRIWCGLKVAL